MFKVLSKARHSVIQWKERQLVFCKLWGAQWDQNHAVSLVLKEFPGDVGLQGEPHYSQHTDMQQGSEGLRVASTALSWSCSLWDGQTARWVANWLHATLSCGELKWLLCFHIPPDLNPTPQSTLPPPWAVPQLQALSTFMQNSTFPQSKCAFMSNFSLPSIILSIFRFCFYKDVGKLHLPPFPH